MSCGKKACYKSLCNTCSVPNAWTIYKRHYGGSGLSQAQMKANFEQWKEEIFPKYSSVESRREIMCAMMQASDAERLQSVQRRGQALLRKAHCEKRDYTRKEKLQIKKVENAEYELRCMIDDLKSDNGEWDLGCRSEVIEDAQEQKRKYLNERFKLGQMRVVKRISDHNINKLQSALMKYKHAEPDLEITRRLEGKVRLANRSLLNANSCSITNTELRTVKALIGSTLEQDCKESNCRHFSSILNLDEITVVSVLSEGTFSIVFTAVKGRDASPVSVRVSFCYDDWYKTTDVHGIYPTIMDEYFYGVHMSRELRSSDNIVIPTVISSKELRVAEDRTALITVTAHISGTSVWDSINQHPARNPVVLKKLGQALRSFHDQGFSHGDANLYNFMEEDEKLKIVVLDTEKCVRFESASDRASGVRYDKVIVVHGLKEFHDQTHGFYGSLEDLVGFVALGYGDGPGEWDVPIVSRGELQRMYSAYKEMKAPKLAAFKAALGT